MNFPGFGTINLLKIFPNNKIFGFLDASFFISTIFKIAIFIAVFLCFYWLVWGAFQYIMAQGKKEELGKARARITWAVVGLMVVFLAYTIARFAAVIFPPTKGQLPF